jgi:hypothetical protein
MGTCSVSKQQSVQDVVHSSTLGLQGDRATPGHTEATVRIWGKCTITV